MGGGGMPDSFGFWDFCFLRMLLVKTYSTKTEGLLKVLT